MPGYVYLTPSASAKATTDRQYVGVNNEISCNQINYILN